MILSIVNHQQCIRSPMLINSIQMVNQLAHEVCEGITVGSPLVHSIEELSFTADSCNDIDGTQSSTLTNHVPPVLDHPSSLAIISISHYTLIDIDDALMLAEELDVLGCSILSLKLCSRVVMISADRANLSIRRIHSLLEVPTQVSLAHSQLAGLLKVFDDVAHLDGVLSCIEQVLYSISCSQMNPLK